jgi:predicted transcriptional regulator of viral defense system
MSKKDEIIKLAENNQGFVTNQDVIKNGYHSEYLRLMVEEGTLERTGRGHYVMPTYLLDEMKKIQSRYGRGIFSHESALFLLGFSDRTPLEHVMTFPRKYNVTSASSNGIKTYRVDEKYYDLGLITTKTQWNRVVRAYSIERSLCDILRPNSNVSIEIVIDAFKKYSKSSKKNLIFLMEYAKTFHVEGKVRNYMEVLL